MPQVPALVVTVSDRCARGEAVDASGPRAVSLISAHGLDVGEPLVIPDGVAPVQTALADAAGSGVRFVVTVGGTGVAPRDLTPEATAPLLERQLPGVAEAIRSRGAVHAPTAVLSRGLVGTIGRTVVVNAPGSLGGVTDTLEVVLPLLPHLLDQLEGGDHD